MKLLADPLLHAAVVSRTRRHFVLDSICYAVGFINQLNIQGRIVDIGCHVGVVPNILATLLPNDVVGVDSCEPALRTAIKKSVGLDNVSFRKAALPNVFDIEADLITCIDVLHHIPESDIELSIRNLINQIGDTGYLMWVTQLVYEPQMVGKLKELFDHSEIGIVCSDVIGGYGGFPAEFSAEVIFIMSRRSQTPLSLSLVEDSSVQWGSHFKEYANNPLTPTREKTQSYERSTRQEIVS